MKEKKNIENGSWSLLAKYLNHEANEEETKLVENWINSSKENNADFGASKEALEKAKLYYQSKRFDTATAWEKINANRNKVKTIAIKQPSKTAFKAMNKVFKYAAAIVLISVLGTLTYYFGFQNSPRNLNKVVSLKKQVLREVVLPDGSVVTLNSNSTLFYPSAFKGNTREVTIKGEAFFDIQPNAAKPFIITAGQASIKVLGTSFNVNAYPENDLVEVIVKTGKVEVTNRDGNTKESQVILIPGEKGTLIKPDNKLHKTINENPNYNAWFTHDLIFENANMDKVIACLNKSYHITIEAISPEINELNLTAHFRDDQSVNYILDVITATFNLELSVEDDKYLLRSQTFN